MSKIKQALSHRLKLAKAKKYIRDHLDETVSLKKLSEISGASPYHFIRVFSAYTSETPFEFVRRQKIWAAMQRLQGDKCSLTKLGLSLGFGSSSAFSKAFKAVTGLSATEFRNLGKDHVKSLMHNVAMNPKVKELAMHLNFELEPEIVQRDSKKILFVEDEGLFEEIAPLVWQKFLSKITQSPYMEKATEFLGISYVEASDLGTSKYTYRAAIAIPELFDGVELSLASADLAGGRYAKFTLKGPYTGVWPAFKKAFAWLNEHDYELADGPCLENYLNDPNITPEDDLLTEIIIPIK